MAPRFKERANWQQIADLSAGADRTHRPMTFTMVVKAIQFKNVRLDKNDLHKPGMKGGPLGTRFGYKKHTMVLKLGMLELYRASTDDRKLDNRETGAVHTIDLAIVRVLLRLQAGRTKIRFQPKEGTRGDVLQMRMSKDKFYNCAAQIELHRLFRQDIMRGREDSSTIDTATQAEMSDELAGIIARTQLVQDRLIAIERQINNLQMRHLSINNEVKKMLESRKALAAASKETGSKKQKDIVAMFGQYVTDADKTNKSIGAILNQFVLVCNMLKTCQKPEKIEQATTSEDPLPSQHEVKPDKSERSFRQVTMAPFVKADMSNTIFSDTADDKNSSDESSSYSEYGSNLKSYKDVMRKTDNTQTYDGFYDNTPSIKQNGDMKEKKLPAPDKIPAVTLMQQQSSKSSKIVEKVSKEPTLLPSVWPKIIYKRRVTLPAKQLEPASVMSILSALMGTGRLPIALFEPMTISMLLSEELYYSYLADKACKEADPVERMLLVTAFAVSCYANISHRSRKPINPLLGETSEVDRWEEFGWRYFCEKVYHNPDIMACHAHSKSGWIWEQILDAPRFDRKNISPSGIDVVCASPPSQVTLTLPNGEIYQWHKVTTTVLQPITTTRFITCHGKFNVTCLKSGCNGVANLLYSQQKGVHIVQGHIADSLGVKQRQILGRWSGTLSAINIATGQNYTLYTAIEVPKVNQQQYYGFSQFAVGLNEPVLPNGMKPAPSDSRYRPDIRLLECSKDTDADKIRCVLLANRPLRLILNTFRYGSNQSTHRVTSSKTSAKKRRRPRRTKDGLASVIKVLNVRATQDHDCAMQSDGSSPTSTGSNEVLISPTFAFPDCGIDSHY